MGRDTTPVKILLVDDHTIYREGIRGLFEQWTDFKIIGEAENGAQALEFCKKHTPYIDIILMDLQMPVMNGLKASRLIHEAYPDIAIIILTMIAEEESLIEAINAGVRGYILKDISARQLKSSMSSVMHGESVLSSAVVGRVLKEVRRGAKVQESVADTSHMLDNLSESEVQVLKLITEGRSNEDIASRLYLSEAGVKKKLTNIMNKLSLDNRVQAAVYATKAGLAE